MILQKWINTIAGSNDLSDINRIYNLACFVTTIFCALAGIESALASLSPILIFGNLLFALIMAFLYYLSRFKPQFKISRYLGIFVLIFFYIPVLWIYNGGSASGIPYYILMFSSFLAILAIYKGDAKKHKFIFGVILVVYSTIVTGLITLEFYHPEIFYHFENQTVRYLDVVFSMLFALVSNYLILTSLFNQYYRQLEKSRDYSKKLEELVIRDSLTNLYNRAFVLSRLADEIEKFSRYQSPFSICMLDVDHFKIINDTYGHSFGDEVLKQIANAIQLSSRSVDIVSRYGGEEFLILLPETNIASALVFGDRLCEAVRKIEFANAIRMTISGGIAEYQVGDTMLTLIDRSDAFLYEAKRAGRNCFKAFVF